MDFFLSSSTLINFSVNELVLISLIFIWTGFVHSGFGGAALGLPLMLFIFNQPIYWLPIIGAVLIVISVSGLSQINF